jgi:pimeloyl-ACP methyl ester carboxylesterase
VAGVHLNNLELAPYLGPDARALTAAEQAYLDAEQAWTERENGYHAVQSTRPQTLACALADSPAGLAAWILDKWRSWSDCGGDLESCFSRDFLLTTTTLYWATGSIATSLRDHFDNRVLYASLSATERVRVPTAVALFRHEFVPEGTPPREWAERLYDVKRWKAMPSGGHFPGTEAPLALARDIAEFFHESGEVFTASR